MRAVLIGHPGEGARQTANQLWISRQNVPFWPILKGSAITHGAREFVFPFECVPRWSFEPASIRLTLTIAHRHARGRWLCLRRSPAAARFPVPEIAFYGVFRAVHDVRRACRNMTVCARLKHSGPCTSITHGAFRSGKLAADRRSVPERKSTTPFSQRSSGEPGRAKRR